jgi:membrane protein implicated in regulation of membrane protease activity
MLYVVGYRHRSDRERSERFNTVWAVAYWAVFTIVFAGGAVATHGVVRVLLLVPATLAGLLLLYTVLVITVFGPKLMRIMEQIDEERPRRRGGRE